jgi:hypothetical protein
MHFSLLVAFTIQSHVFFLIKCTHNTHLSIRTYIADYNMHQHVRHPNFGVNISENPVIPLEIVHTQILGTFFRGKKNLSYTLESIMCM